jgi:hypothetical protein
MLGSAANMIIVFQAAKVGYHTFTSECHVPFGILSTLLCLYAGTFLLATFHFSPECSEYVIFNGKTVVHITEISLGFTFKHLVVGQYIYSLGAMSP